MIIFQKTSKGKIELVVGMHLLLFLLVIFTQQIQLNLFTITGTMMEDALAASNLASAVIDIREYGISNTVQIESPDAAYGLYREALRQNLGLNENWTYAKPDLISGAVTVKQYTIYNVKEEDITVYDFGEDGSCRSWVEQGGLGAVRTPDGVLIEYTSVYSRIGFPVKGVFGISVYAEKDKTVDIASSIIGKDME